MRGADRMQRLQVMLKESFHALNADDNDDEVLYQLASLVYDSMSTPGRVYHTVYHTFDVARDMDTTKHLIQVLAALFHDIVYLTVDQIILPAQEPFLRDIARNGATPKVALPPREDWDWAIHVVDTVFGGLKTPGGNTNEYLSAIVSFRALQDTLTNQKDLVFLTACIEASVPFRPNRPDGSTPMDALFERLQKLVQIAKQHNRNGFESENMAVAKLTDADLIHMVQQSAWFANCDLGSFSSPDTFWFLDTSWQLLPEWWQALAVPQPPLQELFSAIELLTQRYQGTPVDRLFPVFRNYPTDETLTLSKQRCRTNLRAAGRYAWVRLCELGTILQTLRLGLGKDKVDAKITALGGSNVFWKIFYATVRRQVQLAPPCAKTAADVSQQLLHRGRVTSYPWDPAVSPWAIYLCQSVGFDEVVELAQYTGRVEAFCWLESMPVFVVHRLVQILKQVLPTDADAFDSVLEYRQNTLYFL